MAHMPHEAPRKHKVSLGEGKAEKLPSSPCPLQMRLLQPSHPLHGVA